MLGNILKHPPIHTRMHKHTKILELELLGKIII